MTRKDYVVIAKCFNRVRQMVPDDYDPQTWRLLRDLIANALTRDNPRFDRNRFVAACGEFHIVEES